MEVTGINGQSFRAIDTQAVAYTLYGKRINGKSILDMNTMSLQQLRNPYNITLKKNIFGALKAKITAPDGEVLYRETEKFYRGLFNCDPMQFIKGLCEKANSLKNASETIKKG